MKQNFTIVYIVNSDFFYYNNITLQSKIIHCVCIVDQLQLDWWSVALWIRQATDDVSTFLYNVLLWQGHLYFLCVYRFCEVALVLIYKCSSLRRFLLVFSSILHSYLSPFYFWTPPHHLPYLFGWLWRFRTAPARPISHVHDFTLFLLLLTNLSCKSLISAENFQFRNINFVPQCFLKKYLFMLMVNPISIKFLQLYRKHWIYLVLQCNFLACKFL